MDGRMENEAARWEKIKEILDWALDLPAAERAAYLDETCPDPASRAEIEDYLALEEDVEDFIEEPVADLLAEQAAEGREGQEIGAYRLVRPIGHGGMGRVYLAIRADETYQHEVAVKILKRGLDTDEIIARFRRERQILANLEHPNIARIVDGGSTADGLPYFVMEHVEGTPIHQYCEERELTVEDRLRSFRRVCETVHVAHQNLVVHCDLKPSNILIDADGQPKLLDFGIAKLLRPDGTDTTLTRLGGRLGTPRYASPEQTVGGSITTASDVYSLGVVLYEILAGEAPGTGSESATRIDAAGGVSPYATQPVKARPELVRPSTAVRHALARMGKDLEPPKRRRLERLRRRLKGDLDNIVAKATHLEPRRRYGSAADFAEDLGRHLDNLPVRARPDTFLYRAHRFIRRHPAGTVAALMIVVLLTTLGLQMKQTLEQRERAMRTFLVLLDSVDKTDSRTDSDVAYQTLQELNKQLDSETGFHPEDRALMANRIGRMFLRHGFLEEAREALEDSLRVRKERPNVGPEALIEAHNDLALVLLEQEKHEEANALVREALTIDIPPDPEARSAHRAVRNNLATLLERTGNLAAAERVYHELLEERRQVNGEESKPYATTLNNLAEVLLQQNRIAEAMPLLQRSLQLRRQLWGSEHLKTTTALHNLAFAYDALLEHDKAIRASEEVTWIRREHFPEDHPRMADALTMQAFVLLGRGEPADLERAEELLRPALATFRRDRGASSEAALNAQRHLAAVRLARGDAGEAERLLEEVIELRSEKEIDWRLADAKSLLGATLMAQGRLAEAEPLLRQSYPVIRDVKKETSRYTREARERLAALERRLFTEPSLGQTPNLRFSD